MPGGQRICLWMQREQEHITHSHVHAKDERQGKASTDRGREEKKEGLNLEIETFTSCAVLNAKHVSAYCRAWLSQPFRPFPCLRLLRRGGAGEQRTGYVRASCRLLACLKLLRDQAPLLVNLAHFSKKWHVTNF